MYFIEFSDDEIILEKRMSRRPFSSQEVLDFVSMAFGKHSPTHGHVNNYHCQFGFKAYFVHTES